MGIASGFNFKYVLPDGIQVLTHWMPWFGDKSHIDVGYDSTDIATCDRQCQQMKAMGIDGINVDYYGPNNAHHNLASVRMLGACERAGLKYSICIDSGIVPKTSTNPQQVYTDCINYVEDTFYQSPAYLLVGGRPFLNFFGDSKFTALDWNKLQAAAGNSALVFRNSPGFIHTQSDGGFSWIGLSSNPNDPGLSYLSNFYAAGKLNPTKICCGSVYTGFDDSLASWGQHRLMNRNGGKTLLATCGAVPTTGVPLVMIATWNDYEEGSAIEKSLI